MPIRIENHQPVTLVPLVQLKFGDSQPVYLGTVLDRNSTWAQWKSVKNPDGHELVELNRWVFKWEGRWFDLETLEDINRDPCYWRSLGRVMQPGERVVVDFEQWYPDGATS